MPCHGPPGFALGWAGLGWACQRRLGPLSQPVFAVSKQRRLTSGEGPALDHGYATSPAGACHHDPLTSRIAAATRTPADGTRRLRTSYPLAPSRQRKASRGGKPGKRKRRAVIAHPVRGRRLTPTRGYAAGQANDGECLDYRSAVPARKGRSRHERPCREENGTLTRPGVGADPRLPSRGPVERGHGPDSLVSTGHARNSEPDRINWPGRFGLRWL
jgi:hypothetical protein